MSSQIESSSINVNGNAIKSVFNGDLRRFALPARSFSSLRATLVELYPELSASSFVVSFVDEENDTVTVNSTAELEEAFAIASKQGTTLKINVTPTGPAVTAPASPKPQEKAAPIAVETPKGAAPSAPKAEIKAEVKAQPQPEPSDKKPSCAELKQLLLAILKDEKAVAALPAAIQTLVDQIIPAIESKSDADLKALPIVEKVLASSNDLARHPSVIRVVAYLKRKEKKFDRKLNKLRRKANERPELIALLKERAPFVIAALPLLLAHVTAIVESAEESDSFPFESGFDFPAMFAGAGVPVDDLFAQIHGRRGFGFGPGFGCGRGGRGGFGRGGFGRWFGFGGRGGRGGFGRHCGRSRDCAPESEDKEMENKDGVHAGVSCDGCGQVPISGVRYKCTVCPNFDLCASCEAKDQHPATHPLIKMNANKPKEDVHVGVKCDECGKEPIEGVRFKCTTCQDFDLCATCEAKGTHPTSHALIKMRIRGDGQADAYGPARHGHHHGHGRGGWGWRHGHHPHGPHGPFGPHPPGPFGPRFGFFGGPHMGMGPHQHPHPHPEHPHGGPGPLHRFFRAMTGGWRQGQAQGQGQDVSVKHTAEFVKDVNVPDHTILSPGATVIKSWEVRNNSTISWPEGTKLVFLRGDRAISASEEFPVPPCAAGQTVEVSVEIRTPLTAGRYSAFFRLADSTRSFLFGPRLWVDFNVENKEETKAQTSPQDPATSSTSTSGSAPGLGLYPTVVPSAPSAPAVPTTPSASAVPSAPVAVAAASSKWTAQLNALEVIGFGNRELNAYLLDRSNGNVQQVANWLIEKAKA